MSPTTASDAPGRRDGVDVLLERGLGDGRGDGDPEADHLEPGVTPRPRCHLDEAADVSLADLGDEDSSGADHGRDTTQVPVPASQSPTPVDTCCSGASTVRDGVASLRGLPRTSEPVSPVAPSGSHAGRAAARRHRRGGRGPRRPVPRQRRAERAQQPRASASATRRSQAGNADRLAEEIAKRGPILYARRVRREGPRHHPPAPRRPTPRRAGTPSSPPPTTRAATAPGSGSPTRSCSGPSATTTLTAPADGKGLPQFPVTVKDGRVDVDLNADARRRTTTTAPLTGEPLPTTTTSTSEPVG